MRWILLLLLLLGIGAAQAQRECTDNLSEDECDLLDSAFDNFFQEQQKRFYLNFSVGVQEDITEARQIGFYGDGTFGMNEFGNIINFYYTGRVSAFHSETFEGEPLSYFGNWAFGFIPENYYHRDESEIWNTSSLPLESLPAQSLIPSLHDGFEIESYTLEEGVIAERNVLYYHYTVDSFQTENPFRYWLQLLHPAMNSDVESGTGYYDGTILVDVDAEKLIGVVFASSERLNAEDFGALTSYEFYSYYQIIFQDDPYPFNELGIDAQGEFEAGESFDNVSETGLMGLLAASLSTRVDEVFAD